MDCHVPSWIQYLQGLSTPAIAVFALLIGFFQWRTAHQRAVLDLFVRRMEVYDELRSVVSNVVRSGTVNLDDVGRFFRAEEQTRFLFGSEVKRYLEVIRKQMTRHRLAESAVKTEDDEKRARAADIEADAFTAISNFYEEFPSLIMPYVKMRQKAPPF